MIDPTVTGPLIVGAHAHVPIGRPVLPQRPGRPRDAPGQMQAQHQPHQQQAGHERVDDGRDHQPIDGVP